MCRGHRKWREERELQSVNTPLRLVLDVTRQRRTRMLQQFTCECGKHGIAPHRDAAGETLRGHRAGTYQVCKRCGIPVVVSCTGPRHHRPRTTFHEAPSANAVKICSTIPRQTGCQTQLTWVLDCGDHQRSLLPRSRSDIFIWTAEPKVLCIPRPVNVQGSQKVAGREGTAICEYAVNTGAGCDTAAQGACCSSSLANVGSMGSCRIEMRL